MSGAACEADASLAHISLKMRTAQDYCEWRHQWHHNNRFFVPVFHGIDVNNVWFQQGSIACHTPHVTIDLLRETFAGNLIGRKDDVSWPIRGCDLIPLDYFIS